MNDDSPVERGKRDSGDRAIAVPLCPSLRCIECVASHTTHIVITCHIVQTSWNKIDSMRQLFYGRTHQIVSAIRGQTGKQTGRQTDRQIARQTVGLI